MNRLIELKLPNLWNKCKYNPISDISFEHCVGAYGITFLKVYMTFYNEQEVTYFFSSMTSTGDSWYIKPIEYINSIFQNNVPHKIFYYYTLFGTLIILKGTFYDFPMDKLMSYFNIEKLSYDKYAIYEKRHKQNVVGISNYLKEAAKLL